MTMGNGPHVKDKHLLVAVDATDSSKRAVVYVADFLGGLEGFRVTLFSIIPEPEEDFFDTETEKIAWTREKLEEANKMLMNYEQVLVQSGFPPDKVRIRSCVGDTRSFAEEILDIRCDLTCCTVVVGRHHKTKTEEFLFGSISSKIVNYARNCTVWVVE